jgi:aryl-alcohol dehydrogenase-like predicted oxidoreductase
MHAFADAGIDTFEAADAYNGVEALIGAFNGDRRAQRRKSVRVHTRLSVPPAGELSDGSIARSVDQARGRLRTERLDLVQLAMWRFDRDRWRTAASYLAEQSTVDRIGVMNVDVDNIDPLRGSGVPVASAQAQFSLIDRRAEQTLLPACRSSGFAFFGYGALAGGLIGGRWLGLPDPGMTGPFHAPYRVIVEEFGGWTLFQRLLAALDGIAKRHSVGLGTVALRWALDRAGVTAVLVGASNTAYLPALRALGALALPARDMADIDEVLSASTGPLGPVGALERDPDGPMARTIAAHRPAPG